VTAFGFDVEYRLGFRSDENRLTVYDSVAGGMCFRYGDGPSLFTQLMTIFICLAVERLRVQLQRPFVGIVGLFSSDKNRL
jgi:hypothetical protein